MVAKSKLGRFIASPELMVRAKSSVGEAIANLKKQGIAPVCDDSRLKAKQTGAETVILRVTAETVQASPVVPAKRKHYSAA